MSMIAFHEFEGSADVQTWLSRESFERMATFDGYSKYQKRSTRIRPMSTYLKRILFSWRRC